MFSCRLVSGCCGTSGGKAEPKPMSGSGSKGTAEVASAREQLGSLGLEQGAAGLSDPVTFAADVSSLPGSHRVFGGGWRSPRAF